MPDAAPVRMLVLDELDKWRACMKNVSEMSPALQHGNGSGVGLPSGGNHTNKQHFFYFDSTPAIPKVTQFHQNITAALGTNNYIIISKSICHYTLKNLFFLCLFRFYAPLIITYFFPFFPATVFVDRHSQFAFDVACQGLDWSIRNLPTPYSAGSANYVFQMVHQGTPSIQVTGNYLIHH